MPGAAAGPSYLLPPGAGPLKEIQRQQAEKEKEKRAKVKTQKSEPEDDVGSFVPVYLTKEKIEFQGTALEKRIELQSGEDSTAPAELSTVESTVNQGIKNSLRTLHEAMIAVRCHEVWNDWSLAAREMRNRKAGHKALGL